MRKRLAAALAASLFVSWGGQGWGQEASKSVPARLPINAKGAAVSVSTSANQNVADAIAAQLNQSPLLKSFRVIITVQDGLADLAGTVHTPAQRLEVLRLAQSVPGVQQVRDCIQVATGVAVAQAQVVPPVVDGPAVPGLGAPLTLETAPTLAIPPQGDKQLPKVIGGDPNKPNPMPPNPMFPGMPPIPGFGPGFGPGGPGAPGAGGIYEPMPIQGGPPGFPSAAQPPPMPPNAWPTYAPYNNYSRVAYPNLYPYESFPFIGPFYPFPKVPLGWRSVTLQWEDGHWWYGRNATGHDWWRVRYW